MTNHSEWLDTNDNQIALCPVNMAGKVRLPNSCSAYIFFTNFTTCGRALTWSRITLSWRLAYSGHFFSMLRSVSSMVIYSKQLWSFHPVSATPGKPYFLDPIKYIASLFEHEYFVLAMMDLVHPAVPMRWVLGCVWDFHNKPIFHRHSQFDAEITSFHIVQSLIDKMFFTFWVTSRLIHVVSNFPLFEPVQDFENVC